MFIIIKFKIGYIKQYKTILYILLMKPQMVINKKLINGILSTSIKTVDKDIMEKDGFKLIYNKKYKLYINGIRVR